MATDRKPTPKESLQQARAELIALLKQREQLNVAIAKQQRRLAAMATLLSESDSDGSDGDSDTAQELNLGGLTDAVRTAIKTAHPHGLTPKEIRTRLVQLYFPVSEYKNFMASLHSVLKRLVKAKEVKVGIVDVYDGHDTSVYVWAGKSVQLSSSMQPMTLESFFDAYGKANKK